MKLVNNHKLYKALGIASMVVVWPNSIHEKNKNFICKSYEELRVALIPHSEPRCFQVELIGGQYGYVPVY